MLPKVRKWLHSLALNEKYTSLGFIFIAIGIVLWTDDHYFFWPPQFVALMNDDVIDAIATFIGIGLVYYAAAGKHNNTLVSLLLGGATAIAVLITFAQFLHVVFVGFGSMKVGLFLSLFLLEKTLVTARKRNTEV